MTTTTNLIERLEEAAYEWADYVVEDTAPRTLTRHLAPHIEAVAAALEAQAKQIEALNVTVNRWRDEYKELAERTQQDKVCAKDWRNLVQRSQLSGNDLNVQHLKDKCRDLEASKDCHDKVRLTLLKQIKALKQDYLDRCNELNVARMCFEEKIEALQTDQPAQGEPIGYVIHGIDGRGEITPYAINLIKDNPEEWSCDDGGLGEFWSGNEPVYRAALLQSKAEPVNQVLLDALSGEQAERILLNMAEHVDTFGSDESTTGDISKECIRFILDRVAQAQPAKREPLDIVNCDTCRYHYKDVDQKPCNTCIHSGDFVSNFKPRF